MARYVADQNQVGFIYESGTYANASGANNWVGIVTSSNVVSNTNTQSIHYVGGGDRSVGIHVRGALDYAWDCSYHPQDWKLLGYALGSIVDGGANPYTHELKEVNSADSNPWISGTLCPFPSLTVEDAKQSCDGKNFIKTLNGAMINTFELSVEEGGVAEVSVNGIGQNVVPSSGAVTSLTENTVRPFLWEDFQYQFVSGTAVDAVKSMTFTLDNGIVPKHYLNGSRVGDVPLPLSRNYSLALTLDATSQDTISFYNDYFIAGSEFNNIIVQNCVDAGAGSRDALFFLSGCRITEMDDPTENEGADEVSMTVIPKNVNVLINDTTELYAPF